ncbi:MAG: cytochrome c oxidase assembly protein [Nevskia sp.]|nr:cytochrome c oxidase assembly protein [Nevskia sp.]
MEQDREGHRGTAKASRRTAWKLAGVVTAMFGFGFAMVPLYGAICQITGLNGRNSALQAAASAAPVQVDLSRTVKVQFLTTVNGGRGWAFGAQQAQIDAHPGQYYTVYFDAHNLQDAPVVGQAVFSAAPWSAAAHVHKTECFCFSRQAFAAAEDKRMPVRFMIDPQLPADVDTVSFSYTLFDVTQKAPAPQASVAQSISPQS